MIGYLKGKIKQVESDFVILDVNGVGYKVFALSQNSSQLHQNATVEFLIHTLVREDDIRLYGFASSNDLSVFELLISVSGVGAKTAASILKLLSGSEILGFIQKADVDGFVRIPGVGKKMAQKLIVELQSKVGKTNEINLKQESNDAELIQGLVNLGFTKEEAINMSDGVSPELPIEKKIKLSLKKSK